jgi:hypothetical protein
MARITRAAASAQALVQNDGHFKQRAIRIGADMAPEFGKIPAFE